MMNVLRNWRDAFRRSLVLSCWANKPPQPTSCIPSVSPIHCSKISNQKYQNPYNNKLVPPAPKILTAKSSREMSTSTILSEQEQHQKLPGISNTVDIFKILGISATLPEVSEANAFYTQFFRGILSVDHLDRGRVVCSFTVTPVTAVSFLFLFFSSDCVPIISC